MNSSARQIGNIENRITQRIQGKIFDLYSDKSHEIVNRRTPVHEPEAETEAVDHEVKNNEN